MISVTQAEKRLAVLDHLINPLCVVESVRNNTVTALPIDILNYIMFFCGHQDRIHFSVICKVICQKRFDYFPTLRHFHFHNVLQVDHFLISCQQNRHRTPANLIRCREDYQLVDRVSFTLSENFQADDCIYLFKYFQQISYLSIRFNEIMHAPLAKVIANFLKAAGILDLHHVTIRTKYYFENDANSTLPDTLWQCQNLVTLKLDIRSKQTRPQETVQLVNLQPLTLTQGNFCLSNMIGRLPKLHTLVLKNLRSVNLCETLEQFQSLRWLIIEFVEHIIFPTSLKSLEKLKYLILNCVRDNQLPEALGQLHNLKFLTMSNMLIRSLPESLANLQKLEWLSLSHLDRLYSISFISRLSSLQSLYLYGVNIENLPEDINHLKYLTEINFQHLERFRRFPDSFSQLSTMRFITINACYLFSLSEQDIAGLKNLQRLELRTCRYSIPKAIGQLTQLKSLTLTDITPELPLPENLGNLKNLRVLCLSFRSFLDLETNIPSTLGHLTQLETLSLTNYDLTENLPATKSVRLETLLLQLNRFVYLKHVTLTLYDQVQLQLFLNEIKDLPNAEQIKATMQITIQHRPDALTT